MPSRGRRGAQHAQRDASSRWVGSTGTVAVIGAIQRGGMITDLPLTAADEPTFRGIVSETGAIHA